MASSFSILIWSAADLVNSDLAAQVLSDATKRDEFIRLIRDLAYWEFLNTGKQAG
jgi:hypothetical protein